MISFRVMSVKGQAGSGVLESSMSVRSGCLKSKNHSWKISAIRAGSNDIPKSPKIRGIQRDCLPFCHLAISQILTLGSSVRDSNHAFLASQMVI